MKPGCRLKFWFIQHLTPKQSQLIIDSIERKLSLPWYKRLYDWVGIFGQTVKLRFISTPGLDYCSEDVPEHARDNRELLMDITHKETKIALMNFPKHASPPALNKYFKENPAVFEVFGKWDSDD